jgi:hypothetical protein
VETEAPDAATTVVGGKLMGVHGIIENCINAKPTIPLIAHYRYFHG